MSETKPRVLLLDIETAPNKAYVWGLFDQNIAHDQLEESSYVLCWSAKWLGEKTVHFASCKDKPGNDEPEQRKGYIPMLKRIHALLDQADWVVHYYGSKFDIPTLNKEFTKHGMTPPSPYRQIDLKLVVQKVFRFESNKLDYVAYKLFGDKKIKTEFELWIGCMKNDPASWAYMEEYNRYDVVLLERVYYRLRPWIERHPSYSAFSRGLCCPKCGASSYHSRGTQVTQVAVYTRYQCQKCGSWFRDNKRVDEKGVRGVNIVA